jgi:hypothetical protein
VWPDLERTSERTQRVLCPPLARISVSRRSASDLLLVDPSLLLSEEGLAWLGEDESARHEIVSSRALAERLRGGVDVGLSQFIAPEDEGSVLERLERLAVLIESVEQFSYRDVDLPRLEAQVMQALLIADGANGELLADEWAFLIAHSWMASKLRYVLDRFRDVGAVIIQYGRRLRDEMISVCRAQRGRSRSARKCLTSEGWSQVARRARGFGRWFRVPAGRDRRAFGRSNGQGVRSVRTRLSVGPPEGSC